MPNRIILLLIYVSTCVCERVWEGAIVDYYHWFCPLSLTHHHLPFNIRRYSLHAVTYEIVFFYLWAICPLSWLYCYKHRGIHRMQGIRLRSENTWETSQNKKRMSNQRRRSSQLYQYYTNGDLMFFNGHSHTHRHTQRKIMNDHFDQTLPNVFMCRITMKTSDRAVQSGGILSNEQAVCWLCSLCGWSN